MNFGQNLQFLRKLHNGMTQEELAEKLAVSRQTISKWELDNAYPEMDKAIELCQIFSCSMDQMFREDMNLCHEAYSNFRIEEIAEFRYLRYTVVSVEPESDAISHVKEWAAHYHIAQPEIIGWDFPFVTQEQINVYHMHGYTAAWILPPDIILPADKAEVITQKAHKYAAVTIKEPFQSPFSLIPKAYQTLLSYIQMNGYNSRQDNEYLPCFEKCYPSDGIDYMDVYIMI